MSAYEIARNFNVEPSRFKKNGHIQNNAMLAAESSLGYY